MCDFGSTFPKLLKKQSDELLNGAEDVLTTLLTLVKRQILAPLSETMHIYSWRDYRDEVS